jgi:prepilin peptidase CpaA
MEMRGETMLIQIAVILLAGAACFTDLRWRRIPNLLVLSGFGLGAALNLARGGWSGLATSLVGAGLGLALFLPFFALEGMGAGDVKLLAALGSLLGPASLLGVALIAALAGGAMALAAALWRRKFIETVRGVGRLVSFWAAGGLRPSPELSLANPAALKIPYAVPLAAGACILVLSQWSWR